MPGSIVIDKDNKLPNSQNYRFLRKEGIALIQNLSGDSWTDYNTHDPVLHCWKQFAMRLQI